MVNADSSNERYQSLLADNYVHLGTALYKTEYAHTRAELNEALGYYRKALSIHRQLMKTNPEDPDYRSATAADSFWVAATYCSLGDLSGDGEYYQQARESFLTQVELDSALLQSDPTNDRYRRVWADAVICVADRRASLGDIAEVDRSLGEALAVIEAIAAADPTNTEGRSDLVVGEYVLAEYAVRKGDAATARDLARKAAATAETLLREEPDTGATVFDAILSSSRLASVEKSLGRYEGALAAYESALRTANEWLGKKPRDIPTSRLAGMTLLEMGQLHEAMGNWRAAKPYGTRSLMTSYRRTIAPQKGTYRSEFFAVNVPLFQIGIPDSAAHRRNAT